MTDKELVTTTISRYMDLLRIECAANRDAVIETQKRELRAALESMGVSVEDLRVSQ